MLAFYKHSYSILMAAHMFLNTQVEIVCHDADRIEQFPVQMRPVVM